MLKSISIILLAVAVLSCSNQAAFDDELAEGEGNLADDRASAQKTLVAMENKAKRLLSVEQCAVDSDCATIGIGAKACGGPDYYAVYSKISTDEQPLLAQVASYNMAKKQYNDAHAMISNCLVEPRPIAKCVSQVCVLRAVKLEMQ